MVATAEVLIHTDARSLPPGVNGSNGDVAVTRHPRPAAAEADQAELRLEHRLAALYFSCIPELSTYLTPSLLFRYIVEKDAYPEEMWAFYTNRGPADLAAYIKESLKDKRIYENSELYPELMECFPRPDDRFKVQDRGISLRDLEAMRRKCLTAESKAYFQGYINGIVD
jgi:hypothetical protein